MNIKDVVVSFLFAILVIVTFRYFFSSSQKSENIEIANKTFIAPEFAAMAEPLQLDVDFKDNPKDKPEELTSIITDYGNWLFSNYGATVKQITYSKKLSQSTDSIKALVDSTGTELGAFLVALDGLGQTPYFYDLIDKQQTTDASIITYQAETDSWLIKKQFIVHKKLYQLDLNLTLESKKETSNKVRVFIPAPVATEAKGISGLSAVFYDEKNQLEQKTIGSIGRFGKLSPSILGIESHYFANVMYGDSDNFAKRGYFKVENDNAAAILQTDLIDQSQSWHLSFYCGPKEYGALSEVSDKLTGLLSFGWFSPLSRGMLVILNFFKGIFNNYGWAIVMLTILVKLVMLPFMFSMKKSERKRGEVEQKLKYVEQKYRHDPQELARQRADIYRKHGLPGMMGIFSAIIQFPILIALSKLVSNAFELYQAPFLWIPDLTATDPYYILPIIAGLSIAVTLGMRSKDPKEIIAYLIAGIFISSLFTTLSAGLLLFIGTSSILGILQSYIQKG